jgi:hypothetical protein
MNQNTKVTYRLEKNIDVMIMLHEIPMSQYISSSVALVFYEWTPTHR